MFGNSMQTDPKESRVGESAEALHLAPRQLHGQQNVVALKAGELSWGYLNHNGRDGQLIVYRPRPVSEGYYYRWRRSGDGSAQEYNYNQNTVQTEGHVESRDWQRRASRRGGIRLQRSPGDDSCERNIDPCTNRVPRLRGFPRARRYSWRRSGRLVQGRKGIECTSSYTSFTAALT